MRTCPRRGCVYSAPHKLTFSHRRFFHGQPVSNASPTARTTRFCILQVRTRAGETFRTVCGHAQARDVSTRPLTNLLFPPKPVFSRVTESRTRPPLPAIHGFASDKFIHVLEKLFVTFERMPLTGVCLLVPSGTHFFPTGGFFTGNRVPNATSHCPHYTVSHRTSSSLGVSTRPLTNSLFPHRRLFHGQPSPESAPHYQHYTFLLHTSSYLRWRNFS